jgi:alpha-ketoglutarate-dependent taurine dioxygenase
MADIEIVTFNDRPDAKTLTERATFVVTDYPTQTNDALFTYAAELKTGKPDVRAAFPQRPPGIHLVQELPKPQLNAFGHKMLSTTNDYFPLHTDEYFDDKPSRFVLLLCITPADEGGTTLVAHIDDIVADLDAPTRAALMLPVFPTQVGPKPLLEETAEGWSMRFNELEIRRAKDFTGTQNRPLPKESIAAIIAMRESAESHMRRYDLKSGDCLVIHNHRTLHGRTEFSGKSRRMMKRLRIR